MSQDHPPASQASAPGRGLFASSSTGSSSRCRRCPLIRRSGGEVRTAPEPSGTGESCLRARHFGAARRPEEVSKRGPRRRYRSGDRRRFRCISGQPDWYPAGNPMVPWRTASRIRQRLQRDSSGSSEHLLVPAYVWRRMSPIGPETVRLAPACANLQPAAFRCDESAAPPSRQSQVGSIDVREIGAGDHRRSEQPRRLSGRRCGHNRMGSCRARRRAARQKPPQRCRRQCRGQRSTRRSRARREAPVRTALPPQHRRREAERTAPPPERRRGSRCAAVRPRGKPGCRAAWRGRRGCR